MSENSTASSGGIGFAGLLTIVFITLKLCHVISWPWLWVLAPLWISLAVALGLIVILLVFAVIAAFVSTRR